MIDRFPPSASEEEPISEPRDEDVPEDDEGLALPAGVNACGDEDLARDVSWVYRHLDLQGTRAQDAPGAGAWSLLQWARRNRNPFYDRLLPRAMADKRRRAEEEAHKDEQVDLGLDEVKRLLSSVRVQTKDRKVAAAVDRVNRWATRTGLALPAGAAESLAEALTEEKKYSAACPGPVAVRRAGPQTE